MKTSTTTSRLIVLTISIASCVSVCLCYPSKPLNERSTELAWQAWLLVDQTNNNRQNSDLTMLRKRITPKSVFIAPAFSPDSLPACPEGYKSDAMGRCVKIIKINESIHFDFLLQKLKEQFPDYDDEEEETGLVAATSNPLQFNIPIVDISSNDDENEAAIVVTGNYEKIAKKNDVKRDNIESGAGGTAGFTVKNVAAILGVKPEDVEMTTFAAFTTRQAGSESTLGNSEETTTLVTTTASFEEETASTIIADAETSLAATEETAETRETTESSTSTTIIAETTTTEEIV